MTKCTYLAKLCSIKIIAKGIIRKMYGKYKINSSTPVLPLKVQYFLTHQLLYGPASLDLYGISGGFNVELSAKLQFFSLQIVQSTD